MNSSPDLEPSSPVSPASPNPKCTAQKRKSVASKITGQKETIDSRRGRLNPVELPESSMSVNLVRQNEGLDVDLEQVSGI